MGTRYCSMCSTVKPIRFVGSQIFCFDCGFGTSDNRMIDLLCEQCGRSQPTRRTVTNKNRLTMKCSVCYNIVVYQAEFYNPQLRILERLISTAIQEVKQ